MVKKMIEALKKRYSNLGLSEELLSKVAPIVVLGLSDDADEAAIDARASESYVSDMLKTMQSQLNALQANINATAGRSPVNTASLSEVAAKAGQATSAVQNMNKAISSTSAAAKSASEAERQLKKIADAATQARALLNKNMEASGSASYQKLNAELKEKGYLTISGRVNKQYFMEKTCYGTSDSKERK